MPDRDIKPYIIEQLKEGRFHLAAIFGNDHPVELEIGIGKGRFLMNEAARRPDVNFVGIEWASRYYRLAAERAAGKRLSNIRFLRDDAAHTLRENLPDASLSALHIYFPDPWPKSRHHKRRLIQGPFVLQAARVLKDGARVFLGTDHADYAEQMEREFSDHRDFTLVSRLFGDEAPEGITNWEQKFRKEGRTIFKFEYLRRARDLAAPARA